MLGKHYFLVVAVEKRELTFGMNNRERQARKPRPRTDVEDALTLQQRPCDQTVQKVGRDHLVSIPYRGQIDFAIPPLQLIDQRAQFFRCIV